MCACGYICAPEDLTQKFWQVYACMRHTKDAHHKHTVCLLHYTSCVKQNIYVHRQTTIDTGAGNTVNKEHTFSKTEKASIRFRVQTVYAVLQQTNWPTITSGVDITFCCCRYHFKF